MSSILYALLFIVFNSPNIFVVDVSFELRSNLHFLILTNSLTGDFVCNELELNLIIILIYYCCYLLNSVLEIYIIIYLTLSNAIRIKSNYIYLFLIVTLLLKLILEMGTLKSFLPKVACPQAIQYYLLMNWSTILQQQF